MNGHIESQPRRRRLRDNIIRGLGALLLLVAAVLVMIYGNKLLSSPKESSADQPLDAPPATIEEVRAIGRLEPLDNTVNGLSQGEMARDFTLPDLDGNDITLSHFLGQPVIINIWATWCAPCRIEMPELEEALHRYEDDNLVILALNFDETAEQVNEFFNVEMKLSFTPLLDDGAVIDAYDDLGVLPTTFFIDPSGMIVAVHRGPMTGAQIDQYMAAVLATS